MTIHLVFKSLQLGRLLGRGLLLRLANVLRNPWPLAPDLYTLGHNQTFRLRQSRQRRSNTEAALTSRIASGQIRWLPSGRSGDEMRKYTLQQQSL
eukprot:COSAG04_NODE_6039_length_1424_cov_2.431698_1_plen_95_part_00